MEFLEHRYHERLLEETEQMVVAEYEVHTVTRSAGYCKLREVLIAKMGVAIKPQTTTAKTETLRIHTTLILVS
jgi:hypothetical protein